MVDAGDHIFLQVIELQQKQSFLLKFKKYGS
jgi:hypothetical protein